MDRVSICNHALAKVGEQRIVSLDEDSKNGILCRLHYYQTRDEVLRAHRWNCAIKRAELAEDSETPAFGYDHQFVLPIDCLRVLRMEDPLEEFAIEGRRLLADNDTCKIQYIYRVEDESKLDPLCVKVLTLELAIKLAYNLTETRTMVEGLYEEAKLAWTEARCFDAHEGTPEVIEFSEWLDSRLRGPSIGKSESGNFRDIETGT